MRILVVEDDVELATILAQGLRNATYATDVARTRAEAEELLLVTHYDVACLDLGLPDGDGLDLVKSLSGDSVLSRPARIIVITARDGVAQRVAGLDAGADDYLVKPFAFDELLARIRAVSRREGQTNHVLRVDDIEFDTAAMTVTRGGVPIGLTARETALLQHLLRHPGQVLSAENILEHVWDAHADPFTNSVRVIMSRLRAKLGDPPVIHTITSSGYRLGGPQ